MVPGLSINYAERNISAPHSGPIRIGETVFLPSFEENAEEQNGLLRRQ